MNVAQELLDCATAFIEGRIALPELQLWLAGHVQVIADANDPRVTEFSHEAWILIGEWLDGLRDEPSVRAELREFLAQRASAAARPALTPKQ